VLTQVVGTGAYCGYSGDAGPALSAQLCSVTDLALDETHGRRTLYLTDTVHSVVRAVDLLATPPTIDTIAGAGSATTAPFGDGALATEATLADPEHVTVDPTGTHLYVSEYGTGRSRIRRIDLSTGLISAWLTIDDAFCAQAACKVAFSAPDATHPNGSAFFSRGYGSYFFALFRADDPEKPGTNVAIAGNSSDRFLTTADGPALGQYFMPGALLIGPDGRLYLTDPYSMRVRVLSDLTTSATMTTLAGIATTGNGSDGPAAASVGLKLPLALAFAPNGSLLVADTGNFAVREIWKLVH
jgi:DNA-binding beta-propeller fold protein YncE